MNTKQIKFEDTEEVKEFVKAAGQCDFDIDVKCDRVIIDAKSILGVISLGLSKVLTVQYGGENDGFEDVVSKFQIA